MSDKTQPLCLITLAFLDLGFSSSRFRRFGITQWNKIVRVLSPWVAATAPHNNGMEIISEALIDR
jgi:hypothetical protein